MGEADGEALRKMGTMTKRMTRLALALGLTALWLAVPAAAVEEAWVARYDGLPNLGFSPSDYVQDLEVRDDYVYVTGYEDPFAGSSSYATVKYDYAGKEQWVRNYGGGQTQRAEALQPDQDASAGAAPAAGQAQGLAARHASRRRYS